MSGAFSMHALWTLLSALGNSKWLLPAAVLLVLFSGPQRWVLGARWLGAVACVSLLVLASKLAFMGWGVGSHRLDFTGFSGHATLSAAIYPVALGLLAGPRWRGLGIAAGVLLALAISYSRLPLHAHSVSEVVSGSILGLMASVWFYQGGLAPMRAPLLACGAAVVVAAAASQNVMPGVATHDIVMRLAQSMSGRDVLYDRAWLRQSRKAV
ncbi:MAG: phosphatase [Comamonas sp.]